MKPVSLALFSLLLLAGCERPSGPSSSPERNSTTLPREASLAEARRGFQTKLVRREAEKEPVPEPPPGLFRTVRYDSPAGKLAAYLSPDPGDGKKHPAILWIFGGFGNGIGATAWKEQPASEDQSASAFLKAGLVMMYPSLRGGNDNPGFKEGFFGEVDDVLAAADFLAKQPYVDPTHIYLGGHSTGGTLALLAAECSDRFRAVFSFGPVDNVTGYGPDKMPFDPFDWREVELRAPGRWLHSIRSPVFVFEGTVDGNVQSLLAMQRASTNPLAHFYPINGANHFSILAPVTRLIARKIVADRDGPKTTITFTEQELANVMNH